MKKVLLLVAFFLTNSCSDGYRKERDFRIINRNFDQKENSIIIVKTAANYEHRGKSFDSGFTEMNWCKDEQNKKCSEIFYQNPYSNKKFYSQHNYYIIDSGSYYLNKIKQERNHPEYFVLFPIIAYSGSVGSVRGNFNTSPSGWNKNLNSPNFASFETNPGEIVYIGDLYFTFTKQKYWIRGKINLEVQDNYKEAVKYFYEKHPEFKNKPVVKRLTKSGVLLDNFDAGIFW